MKAVKIISGIIATILLAILVWGILYLSVQPVKDWTDKNIFQIEHVAVDKEEIEEDDTTPLPDIGVPDPDIDVVEIIPDEKK